MTNQRYLPRLIAGLGAGALSFLFLAATTTNAATVANWNFEDGVAGQSFTPAGQPNGSGGSTDTVNGILMRGWNTQYGPSWSDVTTARPESNLSARFVLTPTNGQDGYVTGGALHNWAPNAWTIETAVYLETLTGWNSLIGRQGSSVGVAESDFYLQNNGIDDKFRINFLTEGGQRWILDGNYTPVTNKWYGVAVKSDGVTLSMLIDDGHGYQQVGTLDMSAQTPAQNALRSSALDWTFGRSWFGGNNVDQINGFMDDVRFSDVALAANQLIGVNPPAAPLTIRVNKSTGNITIRNDGTDPVAFDYYLIESNGNALNPTTWNSLSDQNIDAGHPADFNNNGVVDSGDVTTWKAAYGTNANADANGDGQSDGQDFLIWQRSFGQTAGPGDSWDEAGTVDNSKLAELFLNSASTLAPGQTLSLGNAYRTNVFGANDGDLTFKYGLAGSGLIDGSVTYLASLSAVSVVPEPTSIATILLALSVVLGSRARVR
jgi:hypothetical protein